ILQKIRQGGRRKAEQGKSGNRETEKPGNFSSVFASVGGSNPCGCERQRVDPSKSGNRETEESGNPLSVFPSLGGSASRGQQRSYRTPFSVLIEYPCTVIVTVTLPSIPLT